jgi:glucokinase
LVVGVDLGGTKIQTVVLRAKKVVSSSKTSTPRADGAAVVSAMAGTVRDALALANLPLERVRAIGVGSPGKIDATTGTVSQSANVPGLEGSFQLGPALGQALGGIQVMLDNDVRAGIWGEFVRGAGQPYRNLIGVWVGTGVGGGLILDGVLRHGRGACGEIGHTVVKDGGRRCPCGRRGCLEAYAGRASMEWHARRWQIQGERTILFEVMEKQARDRLTSGILHHAIEHHDEMAMRLIDDAVWALGIALASAQNLLDTEAIIIGGGLGERFGAPFLERIAKAMRPHLFVPDRPPSLLGCGLGEFSGAVGAAVIAGG